MFRPTEQCRRSLGRGTLAAIACFFVAAFARAQDAVQIAPRPAWVDPAPLEDRVAQGSLRGAVDYLLFDFQDDARGAAIESYVHVAKRVLNEQGVQHQSEVSIDFDPTCQELSVHTVALVRGGERIDALAARQFQVIQRESQLERQVYDGTRTALLFVEGVRVDDVIDLEYTIRGRSPLFEGRYSSTFVTQLTVPVLRMRKRILWDDARTLHHRGHGIELEPSVRSIDHGSEFIWDLRDREPITIESDVPSWFEPLPWIQFSEYEDWGEVARWGAKLFALPESPTPAIAAAAANLRGEKRNPTEELRRALRFVQGEIRYLCIALGEGSHRPSAPEEVLERRYGDCKDKALLLVALLRELGITARPALVNTDRLHGIASGIASPDVFDHVIVHAVVGTDDWWVDPTLSHERGPLSEQSLLHYSRALELDPAIRDLSVVQRDQGTPTSTTIQKTFHVRVDGATSFHVETVYEGADANAVRSGLDWQTTQELTDRCRDFYLADYPSLAVEAPAEVFDQEEQNRLIVREKYSIPDFWGRNTSAGWARFTSREINDELRAPETTRRTSPVGLAFPRRVTCNATVLLPEHWEIEPETVRVRNGSMSFEHRVSYTDRQLELHDAYETIRNHVPAAECAAFAADVEKARHNLQYEISDPTGTATTNPENEQIYAIVGGAIILGIVGIVCAMIFGIVWVSRRTGPHGPASTNPFAPLSTRAIATGVPIGFEVPKRGVWREGSLLVMDLKAELPPRCVYCNRDEAARIRRQFTWHPPMLYFLILAGVLIYAIVAYFVSKRAQIAVPLCDEHSRRRVLTRAAVVALVIGGVAGCAAGSAEQEPGALFWLGFGSIIAALIVGFRSRLNPARIDDQQIRLRGAGTEFLDSLANDVHEMKRAA